MGKLEKIRKGMMSVVEGMGEEMGVEEVFDGGLEERVNLVREYQKRMRGVQKRLEKLRSAGEVFGDFGRDAAEGKVLEMYLGSTSSDRQRAQETVLDRSLGKVVDRVMSLNVEVSSLKEGELDRRIRELQDELGYTERKGEFATILIGEEEVKRCGEVEGIQGECGVSGEVCEVAGAGEIGDGGQQVRKDLRSGV